MLILLGAAAVGLPAALPAPCQKDVRRLDQYLAVGDQCLKCEHRFDVAFDIAAPHIIAAGCDPRAASPCSKSMEDEEIAGLSILGWPTGGYFVEIGGLQGMGFSNTLLMELCLGWRGTMIEANPENYEQLVKNRPNTSNIGKAACSASHGGKMKFVGRGAVGGAAGLQNDQFDKDFVPHRQDDHLEVPCAPFDRLLDEAGAPRHVDFWTLE
jgi:hypothetical protein